MPCGFAALTLNAVASGVNWYIGAYIIIFHNCDYLCWNASGVRYDFVGAYCNSGVGCGFANLGLDTTAYGANWNNGASFILFYDCDFFYWNVYAVYYALVGACCLDEAYCGFATLTLNNVVTDAYCSFGAFHIIFYDCDSLWWRASDVCYAEVGNYSYYGTNCGFAAMNLNYPVFRTNWDVGASLIIFYDCDYLYWTASGVLYAFVGGSCGNGSNCGSMTLALNNVASFVYWWIGASF